MVAPVIEPGEAAAPLPSVAGAVGGVLHSQLAGTLTSLGRLADLQVAIWLGSVRQLVMQLVVVALLSVLALLAVVVAVMFFYAGLFHVLTDLLHVPTVWALLIFAGAHVGLAGSFVLGVVAILNRKSPDEKKDLAGAK